MGVWYLVVPQGRMKERFRTRNASCLKAPLVMAAQKSPRKTFGYFLHTMCNSHTPFYRLNLKFCFMRETKKKKAISRDVTCCKTQRV